MLFKVLKKVFQDDQTETICEKTLACCIRRHDTTKVVVMDWVRVTNATSDQVPTTARTYPIEFRRMSSVDGCCGQKSCRKMCKRCAAPGPMGQGGSFKPKTISRLHGSSQYNKQLSSANCLFLLDGFLKIMVS